VNPHPFGMKILVIPNGRIFFFLPAVIDRRDRQHQKKRGFAAADCDRQPDFRTRWRRRGGGRR
jgi:hypothetical protein